MLCQLCGLDTRWCHLCTLLPDGQDPVWERLFGLDGTVWWALSWETHGSVLQAWKRERRRWGSESAGMPGQRLTFMVAVLSFVMNRGTYVWCASMCFVYTCMISQEWCFFSELFPWPSSLLSPKSPVSPSQSLEMLVNISSEHVQARTKKDNFTVPPKTK